MSLFRYADAVAERFPSIVGGVIHAQGVHSGPAPEGLREALAAEVDAARARIGTGSLSEIASLSAWRRTFRGFGVDPTQYRSAAEALLRRITRAGAADLPSINALVDLANLVSVRYALPVAVFDLDRIAGGALTVTFATGDEPWADLGASEADHPDPGEVVFLDDDRVVHARRWCWRQSAASAARGDTSRILVTVEGLHAGADAGVRAALTDLEDLLRAVAAPDSLRSGTVTAAAPAFP